MQAFILWGSSLIAIHGKSSRVEMQEKGAKGMTACKVDFFFLFVIFDALILCVVLVFEPNGLCCEV